MNEHQKILVVDDEEEIREGVCRWLSAGGFETVVASDGDEALHAVRETAPNAILLDVLMPKRGGMETLADLRADAATSMIPVVMLSASLRDEQRALDAGASFFVRKPYDGKELLAAVHAAMN